MAVVVSKDGVWRTRQDTNEMSDLSLMRLLQNGSIYPWPPMLLLDATQQDSANASTGTVI